MPLLDCRFKSRVLELDVCVRVILPDKPGPETSTLYLLHGLSDDETIWTRRTSLERYVDSLPLAVVMPGVNRSFYQDMHHGLDYWTYLSVELPERMASFFKLSQARKHNFAAGLSMGGYGAFRLALAHPERFAAAASLSGALYITNTDKANKADFLKRKVFHHAFGESGPVPGTQSDLFHLATQLAKKRGPKPKLLQTCGKDDFLIRSNQLFAAHCAKIGLPLNYQEDEGSHDWGYWDLHIQQVVGWLPIPGMKRQN